MKQNALESKVYSKAASRNVRLSNSHFLREDEYAGHRFRFIAVHDNKVVPPGSNADRSAELPPRGTH
jgi:hypothetical protein